MRLRKLVRGLGILLSSLDNEVHNKLTDFVIFFLLEVKSTVIVRHAS